VNARFPGASSNSTMLPETALLTTRSRIVRRRDLSSGIRFTSDGSRYLPLDLTSPISRMSRESVDCVAVNPSRREKVRQLLLAGYRPAVHKIKDLRVTRNSLAHRSR